MQPRDIADIEPARLSETELAQNFADAHPPMDRQEALVAADRCYFCYDAPCVKACPTGIDIPSFIRKIATDNIEGSAADILEANIMGGMCARVCPTEILCEEACVRNLGEEKPVEIGALQRYATDPILDAGTQLFSRKAPTGKTVAIVGGGPAGLACAHALAREGHEAVVFEAKDKLGGLNEYGIAAYKVPGNFAQREVDYILSLGGITAKCGLKLGRDIDLATLRRDHDAVFIGVGLAGVRALGAGETEVRGVEPAVDFIARLRQAGELARLPVGRRVVVIGGGNTAIDAATQSARLGAEDVTMVYRRGREHMSATPVEQDWAKTNGVRIKTWAQPVGLESHEGAVTGVVFERTAADPSGKARGTGRRFTVEADMVLTAIGQTPLPQDAGLHGLVDLTESGRFAVGDDRATSIPGVWAGGDCIANGQDLTVAAVEDGKVAARAIHQYLST